MAKIFKTNAETKLATAKKLGIALDRVEVRARNYPPLSNLVDKPPSRARM
jgi:hypothetical protein